MEILGIIVIVTGIGLLFAGRITSRSLPPDYREEQEDGFLELLKTVGNVISAIGILFILGGLVCCFL